MNWEEKTTKWLETWQEYVDTTKTLLSTEKCIYCLEPAETFDHVIPRALGGLDEANNLVPVCRLCNGSKSAQTLTQWVESLDKRLETVKEYEGPEVDRIQRIRNNAAKTATYYIEPSERFSYTYDKDTTRLYEFVSAYPGVPVKVMMILFGGGILKYIHETFYVEYINETQRVFAQKPSLQDITEWELETAQEYIAFIRNNPGCTIKQMLAYFTVSENNLRNQIALAEKYKRIRHTQMHSRAPFRYYV